MKAKNTLTINLIHTTLNDKLMNFVGAGRCLGGWARWESLGLVKKTFPNWQYTGAAPFDEVAVWCEEHFGNNWIWEWETIYFKHEKDLVFFKLRWS